jgi:hypothetical protein
MSVLDIVRLSSLKEVPPVHAKSTQYSRGCALALGCRAGRSYVSRRLLRQQMLAGLTVSRHGCPMMEGHGAMVARCDGE